jgi:hypothetical protein
MPTMGANDLALFLLDWIPMGRTAVRRGVSVAVALAMGVVLAAPVIAGAMSETPCATTNCAQMPVMTGGCCCTTPANVPARTLAPTSVLDVHFVHIADAPDMVAFASAQPLPGRHLPFSSSGLFTLFSVYRI